RLLESCSLGLRLIEPVGYLHMAQLERHARLIATDSGGVQKEAFFYRVPCVTFREQTEWVELVKLGWNRLVPPTNAAVVRNGVLEGLTHMNRRDPPADLFGGGKAAGRIVASLRAAA